MAVLTFTKIESNLIGDTGITISEQTSSLNAFLNSLGGEKLILSSLNLWSDNPDQIRQPITITKTDIDGSAKSVIKIIQLNNYQYNNTINSYPVEDIQFDPDTKFEYNILANTKIQFTLNFSNDSKITEKLSNVEQLKKAINLPESETLSYQVIESLGLSEIEEEQKEALKKGVSPKLVSTEPEEKKSKIKPEVLEEPEEKEDKKVKKKEEGKKKKEIIIPFDWKLIITLTIIGTLLVGYTKYRNFLK